MNEYERSYSILAGAQMPTAILRRANRVGNVGFIR